MITYYGNSTVGTRTRRGGVKVMQQFPPHVGASHRVVGRDDGAVRAVGPVGRPARPGEGGDNDPRSCLGSLSVVSAKTPTNRPSTLCVRLELQSTNLLS